MDPNICAPGFYDKENNTCLSLENVKEIVKAYNIHVSKKKLDLDEESKVVEAALIPITEDKATMLRRLQKQFENVCHGDELCLTKQSFMNDIMGSYKSLISNSYRGIGPSKRREWLWNEHIDDIMSKYEKIYPDFKFLGAVALDCDEKNFCSLYKLDFNDYLRKGKNKLGIVYNFDKYGENGSHWVAMYMDLKNGKIYYCDSNGKPPRDNMITTIDKFINYYKNTHGKDPIYKYNPISYQKDRSECGVYSCNFLIRILSGEKFESIIENPLDFKRINSCRNKYFRNKISNDNPDPLCDPNF